MERLFTTATLVREVRRYAQDHYSAKGKAWDVLVECWSDNEVLAAIGGAKTPHGAISNVAKYLKPLGEVRADHQAEARSEMALDLDYEIKIAMQEAGR